MSLGLLDLAVLGAYALAILAVGLWFGRGERSTHDYFLGGKQQNWLVVGMSIIATEVSALTFIGVPAVSFKEDWNYLQMYAGSFIGRVLIVFLLLPAFYGSAVTTVYEYLGRRFGPWTRTTASLMFFASRIVGSGIRLLAASLAIAVVFDWPLTWVVIGAASIAVAYTTFGGIKAIIWTDALQALVFLAGGLAVIVFLFVVTPGTWQENLSSSWNAGKLHTFTWKLSPNNEKTFWVLLIHATLFNMAALGTDQDLTQRMLTCPDLRHGQRSLMFNAFAGFPIVCLFLLIGTLMFTYYDANAASRIPPSVLERNDRIFPHFIAQVLPSGYGLKGLLVAGVFAAAMSSLDSALGALSSTAVTDFYRPWLRRRGGGGMGISERHFLGAARVFVLLFGALLVAVALAFAHYDDLLWEAFRWVGLIFGGMLGIFLVAVTTKDRGDDRFNTLAMLSSVAVLVAIKLLQERWDAAYIAWPWWVVIGTGWTYIIAICRRTVRASPTRK
ncbi:MAG: sodium/solute symporter [Phycisphaerales bacterium]|nr:MAG: sodium/solute symporter [Phycisphaerales bacterium]